MPYDAVAPIYDDHFHRRVDRWEDERLEALLAPHVNGKAIIDLGCGTGWVLDHLQPDKSAYLGLDASARMLDVLESKHLTVETRQVVVNVGHWLDGLPLRNEAIVATWAAHDFGNLSRLLPDLNRLLLPGGIVALHGQTPRYAERRHYVLNGADTARGFLRWTERRCRLATAQSGTEYDEPLVWLGAYGTGAGPDWSPTRALWNWTARWSVPDEHFAFLALWGKP
jgi:SAM-dependent methyltransferase